ncbi:hypothetical protein EYS14_24770 [Alteromonadaceae bacterium M269]|nr:hypothetical protein EYS14_24770 [Alteromonadaceae bacterium M269]
MFKQTLLCVAVISSFAIPSPSIAQTETDYAYDVHGRLVKVQESTGKTRQYQYDSAHNRTSVSATASAPVANSAPTCSNVTLNIDTSSSSTSLSAVQSCTDVNNDILTASSVNAPTNGARASLVSGRINVTNIPYGITRFSRQVTDSRGGVVSSLITISRPPPVDVDPIECGSLLCLQPF